MQNRFYYISMAENMNCRTMCAVILPHSTKEKYVKFCAIYRNVHLWSYVYYILLWIIMAEKRKTSLVKVSHGKFQWHLRDRSWNTRRVSFCFNVNWALLWMGMAENQNCLAFGGNLPYRISIISLKWLVGYMEKPTNQA